MAIALLAFLVLLTAVAWWVLAPVRAGRASEGPRARRAEGEMGRAHRRRARCGVRPPDRQARTRRPSGARAPSCAAQRSPRYGTSIEGARATTRSADASPERGCRRHPRRARRAAPVRRPGQRARDLHRRRAGGRRAAASARVGAAPARRRREGAARRLARHGRGAQLLGVVVRAVPRGGAAAPNAGIGRITRAGRDGRRRRRPGRDVPTPCAFIREARGLRIRCCATARARWGGAVEVLGYPETLRRSTAAAASRRRWAWPRRRGVHAAARSCRCSREGGGMRAGPRRASSRSAVSRAPVGRRLRPAARRPRSPTSRTRSCARCVPCRSGKRARRRRPGASAFSSHG